MPRSESRPSKEADEQRPEIDAGRQPGPAHLVGIKTGAGLFHEVVASLVGQQSIQAGVKRMAGGRRQLGRRLALVVADDASVLSYLPAAPTGSSTNVSSCTAPILLGIFGAFTIL